MNITEPMFLALTALVDEPRHGYGIVQEVDRLSGGRVQLKIGSLYGVLDRLAADGLVELDREEVQQGRLRRYYRLTDEGAEALAGEATRLAANAEAATARLRARRAGPGSTAPESTVPGSTVPEPRRSPTGRGPITRPATALVALAGSALTALAARAAVNGGVA
ncbi:DNA-binding PadR family transcriptional regulator [Nonomuraea muscovyensis]|uniref:DNA-binding PadR family transcriptional regulator n=1 Tax=Nonomuraea muscovyensis TaxID=1124761 RepID=A0A7X0BXS9_9ACTN|nr:PadR family transcriptional regulator [Nonomuraea muscovyensis]MBB6344707.1 DNA-binding PadR family transcriptional regulator [Nonomuraea muscovyensis]